MKKCPVCKKVWIMKHWTKCTHCAELDGDRNAGQRDMK